MLTIGELYLKVVEARERAMQNHRENGANIAYFGQAQAYNRVCRLIEGVDNIEDMDSIIPYKTSHWDSVTPVKR